MKFKTDNGPDGYDYDANGSARNRYCAYYDAGEFDGQAEHWQRIDPLPRRIGDGSSGDEAH